MVREICIQKRALVFGKGFSTPLLTQALDQSSPRISNNSEADYTLSNLNVLSIDVNRYVTADVSVHVRLYQGAIRSNGTKALLLSAQTLLQLLMWN